LPSDNKIHARHKVAAVYEAQQEAKKVISQADEEYGRLTGRRYGGLVEWYRASDAKHIVVCAGAWCSDAKHAVDSLRARGVPVGLMRIRFVRPFPREEVAKLDQYETAVVYDRDITPVGGILGLEVKAALSRARVVNIVAGIAGVDFDSRHFYETIQNAIDGGYRDLVFVV
jgi:pyruvate ferredoxin oxidoreductase alpha subunit